jgi:16S rRNA (cytosine967-C5)-methyltransferase
MQPSHLLAESLAEAARVVARVIGGESLNTALGPRGTSLAAAVQNLSYATLRDYGRGDALLAQLLRQPASDVRVRALLLVALRELAAGRAAAYTIVTQAVDAAAALDAPRAKGLVNAVLRNYLRQREALDDAVNASASARHRYPEWWIERARKDHPAHWADILAAGNEHPPLTLRVNQRRIAVTDYLERLTAAGIDAQQVGASAIRLHEPRPVDEIPGFSAGLVSVQDAGAQAAAAMLGVEAGQRVLDACAAPGGKAAHILESADVRLVALDADGVRMRRVSENFARLGLHGELITADAADPASWWDGQMFDRVLLDAPCSASGVVRRHPDIKWLRRATDIPRFARQQLQLLDALWQVLAPGGRMLYATCSVFREENAGPVERFMNRRQDARLLPTVAGGELLPDEEHDGFFYALLTKDPEGRSV